MNEIDRKWEEINKAKRESISFAQSWNLSVDMVSRYADTDEVKKGMIEKWQVYFYAKLMANPIKEKAEAKKELGEKKRDEFINQLD